MRFLSKVFVAVAAASALLSASAADAFSTESFRSHTSNLHSQIQSNQELLASKIQAIHYHTQALSDCQAAGIAPTVTNVKACLSIAGATSFETNCAADLTSPLCKLDIGSAMLLWAKSGGNIPNFPTDIPGFPTGIPTDGNAGGGNGNGNGDAVACSKALGDFGVNVRTKCESVLKDLTPSSTVSPVNVDLSSLLNQQCSVLSGPGFNECKAAIASIDQVQAACPNLPLATIRGNAKGVYEILDGALSALCVKDDADPNKYCLASVISSSTAITNFDPAALTDTVLNGMCKPCINTIIAKIAGLAGDVGSFSSVQTSLKYFQAICTKDPTNPSQYCMNVFSALANTPAGKAPVLSTVCSPCLSAFINNVQSNLPANTIPANVIQQMQFTRHYLCEKDNNGGYCLDVFQSQGEAAFTPLITACSGSTCTDACKAAVTNLFATQSCCFEKLGMRNIDRILEQAGDAADAKLTFVRKALQAAQLCSVGTTTDNNNNVIVANKNTCEAPTATIPVSLSLPNIDATKLENNAALRAKISAALSLDLSAAFSIDASAIVIGKIEADPSSKGGIKVSFSISVDASLRSGYANTFNQRLQKGELSLTNTAKEAEASQVKVDDTQPLSAEGAGASSSALLHSNASIAIVAMTIIAAFFAKF